MYQECPNCKEKIEPMANFCDKCSNKLQRKGSKYTEKCPECKNPVVESFCYCPWCGIEYEDDCRNYSMRKKRIKCFFTDDECPKCHGVTIAAFETCPWCGEDLTKCPWEHDLNFCEKEKCKKIFRKKWDYCIYCGANLRKQFMNGLRQNQGKFLAGFRGYCGPTSMSYCLALLRIVSGKEEVAEACGFNWYKLMEPLEKVLGAKWDFNYKAIRKGAKHFEVKVKRLDSYRELRSTVKKGFPVMVSVSSDGEDTIEPDHWVAVVGYSKSRRRIIVRDPLPDGPVVELYSKDELGLTEDTDYIAFYPNDDTKPIGIDDDSRKKINRMGEK